MISIGVDPDLHCTGMAIVQEHQVLSVAVARVPKTLTGEKAVLAMVAEMKHQLVPLLAGGLHRTPHTAVIEGQQIYLKGLAKKDSILLLAQVAGAAAALATVMGCRKVYMPRPVDWKGSVPKPIHQERVLGRLGIESVRTKMGAVPRGDLSAIRGAEHLKPADWLHVVDAIGLAVWGL